MSQTDTIGFAGVKQKDNPLPARTGFRPDIEGLRAVAVMAVVLFHAEVPGVGGGYVGVDVFFVISGFLITSLLWREMSIEGTVRLRRFYGARARRLLPASATVGVVTAIASALLLPPLQARDVLADGIASALYVANYRFVLNGVDYLAPFMPPSPFLHYWSLGVEEQFYLVWPAIIIGTGWLVRRARRGNRARTTSSKNPYLVVLALIAAGSFTASLLVTQVASFMAFFSLPTRAWQLAVGGLVALTAGQWRRLPARYAVIAGAGGLALILLSCTALSATTPYPGTAALLPVVGSALVIGAGCAAPLQGSGRVLSSSPLRAGGRVSYSWYLWHWPVLLLAPLVVDRPLGLTGRLIAVLVSLVLAVLTLRLIETPLRFAAPLRRSSAGSLAVGGAATVVAVCVCVTLLVSMPSPVGRGAPAAALSFTAAPSSTASDPLNYDAAVRQAFAQVKASVAAAANPKAVPQNLEPPLEDAEGEVADLFHTGCMRTLFRSGQPECAIVDRASPTTVALIGDSHAAMWAPAFQEAAAQRQWRLESFGKGQCPPMDMPIANTLRRLMYTNCQHWRDEIIDRLRTERPQLVVISMFRGYAGGHAYMPVYTPYNPEWLDALTSLVKELHSFGTKVMVLGPIPDPHAMVPICLSGHLDDATACSPLRFTALNKTGIASESAATTAGGGQYVDVSDLFCTVDRCPSIIGNALVYFDDSHLTAEYARALAPTMGALADRVLARR